MCIIELNNELLVQLVGFVTSVMKSTPSHLSVRTLMFCLDTGFIIFQTVLAST